MTFSTLIQSGNTALLAAFGDGLDFPLDHGSLNLTVRGIFTEPGKAVNVMSGEVQSTDPQLVVLTGDVAAKGIAYGTIVTHPVTGADYKVTGLDPDGAGLTILTLTTEPWE